MSDDPASTQRQRIYLQALRVTYPSMLKIIEVRMVASKPYQRLVKPIELMPQLKVVQVFSFTEKKTDVNIAADLIRGAWKGIFDQAVICSNDSALEGALAAIREDHPRIRVGIVAPILAASHRHISGDLARYADWKKILSIAHISKSQLPKSIPNTRLERPATW